LNPGCHGVEPANNLPAALDDMELKLMYILVVFKIKILSDTFI
jgi:hypothetical protein